MECTKTKYTSEEFALDDIKRIKKKSIRDKVPTRAYLCKFCNFWHLTSSQDWKKEALEKDLRITELTQELGEVKVELEKLKKATNREDRIAVKADERVKEANNRVAKQKELVRKLRESNEDLICKNIQLQKKLENGNEKKETEENKQ